MWAYEKYKFAKWVEDSEPRLKQLIKRNLLVKPSHHQPRETEHEGGNLIHVLRFLVFLFSFWYMFIVFSHDHISFLCLFKKFVSQPIMWLWHHRDWWSWTYLKCLSTISHCFLSDATYKVYFKISISLQVEMPKICFLIFLQEYFQWLVIYSFI